QLPARVEGAGSARRRATPAAVCQELGRCAAARSKHGDRLRATIAPERDPKAAATPRDIARTERMAGRGQQRSTQPKKPFGSLRLPSRRNSTAIKSVAGAAGGVGLPGPTASADTRVVQSSRA